MYATIDLDHKLAKLSGEPRDDLRWSPAEITDSTIRWSFTTSSWNDNYLLNRYSGRLNYYHHNYKTGSHSFVMLFRDRTGPPRKRI
jgi:hypothetical protein